MFYRLSKVWCQGIKPSLSIRRQSEFNLGSCRAWSSFTTDHSSITVDSLHASFPYVWLRDACHSPDCVHPSTSQKLHRTSDIPLDIKPSPDGVQITDEGIAIEWMDGHKSSFTKSFLGFHSSTSALSTFHRDVHHKPWDNSSISSSPDLFLTYEHVKTPSGIMAAIDQICRYGLLFVRGVPTANTDDDTCEVRKLTKLFSHTRSTFYGELWDVKNIRNSRNIAYTNLHLGLHMDLQYFQTPPKYQILHCIRNRVEGGKSMFVDTFHAASILRRSHPSDFETLATTPVPFHYINDGHHLHYEHPTLEVSSDGTVTQVNYSPPFQAPLLLSTPLSFYTALGRFAELLDDPAHRYTYTLQEGDAVIFENRRVLHARTAFRDIADDGGSDGETNRWLKGCYFDPDTMWDRGRMLRASASSS